MKLFRAKTKLVPLLLCIAILGNLLLGGISGIAGVISGCTAVDEADGSVTITSAAGGIYTFDQEVAVVNSTLTTAKWPGTETVLPGGAVRFVFGSGALGSWMNFRFDDNAGLSGPKLGLMLRVSAGSSETVGKLQVSMYRLVSGSMTEYMPLSMDYEYGTPVYAFVRNTTDVIRLGVATKDPETDNFNILAHGDWHNGYAGWLDNSNHTAGLYFNGSSVINAKVVTVAEIDKEVNKISGPISGCTAVDEADGSVTITSINSGAYKFSKEMAVVNTELPDATWPDSTTNKLPGGALRFSLDSADALNGAYMNIRFNDLADTAGAKIGLMIRIFATEDPNVGKLRVAMLITSGTESDVSDFPYEYGSPIYAFIHNSTDVVRLGMAFKNADTGKYIRTFGNNSGWHNGLNWTDYTAKTPGVYFNATNTLTLNFKQLTTTELDKEVNKISGPISGCTAVDEADGSVTISSTNSGTYKFSKEMAVLNTELPDATWPASTTKLPGGALRFSLDSANALGGDYLNIRLDEYADTADAKFGLMIRINNTTDSEKGTLRVSMLTGSEQSTLEYDVTDIPYEYGTPIYVFLQDATDVVRFGISLKNADTGKLIQSCGNNWGWHNGGGWIDNNPHTPGVYFNSTNPLTLNFKQITTTELNTEINNTPPEPPVDENLMTVTESGGVYTASATKASYYTIDTDLYFENTAKTYSGTDAAITEQLVKLTFTNTSIGSSWFGVRMMGSADTQILNPPDCMLMFRVHADNGDGTGILRVSSRISGNEFGTSDLEYIFGEPVYISVRYGNDVNRFRVTTIAPSGRGYNTLTHGDWRAGPVTTSAADKSAKKACLVSSAAFSGVTAAVVTDSDVQDIINQIDTDPAGKYTASGVTATGTFDTGYTLSSVPTSWFMFSDAVMFTATSTKFANSDTNKPENALSLKFADANALGGKLLFVRLGFAEVTDGSTIGFGLGIKITEDNGDGTGVIRIAAYNGNAEASSTATTMTYRFGEEIFIFVRYSTDVYRMSAAVKNADGSAYTVASLTDWHDYSWGLSNNSKGESQAKKFCLAFEGTSTGVTAKMVSGNFSDYIAPPPIDTSVPFTGANFTCNKDENEYFDMSLTGYAKSTWKFDLTQGLIFNLDSMDSWISFRIGGDYHSIANSNLGGAVDNEITLLLKNQNGDLYASVWNGATEIPGAKITGVSALGTHLLSVRKVTDDRTAGSDYYKITIDGKTAVPALSIMDASFKILNNYDSQTEEYEGTYFRFGANGAAVINDIRPFAKATAEQLAGNDSSWSAETLTKITKTAEDIYNLDMTGYSCARLNKTADLNTGITFTIKEFEAGGEFGIAFSQLRTSSNLGIPPSITSGQAVYYTFKDNGDGTVTITNQDGVSATITLDLLVKHTYGFVKLADGSYSFAVDGVAVFTNDLAMYTYVVINNGGLGAFPTIFTKSKLSITGFTGKLTAPLTSGEDDEWKEDEDDWVWEEDEFGDEDELESGEEEDLGGDVQTGDGFKAIFFLFLGTAAVALLTSRKKLRKRIFLK